ncbi:YitT family protein [Candidatus Magnetominusculus xianensis]|uniref:Membrane protein n=1 Tax=Candidatus Magnetominusculus xianensis TaxID=1748249 RepID=A0ABR5SDF2_9BACT|nr:YitT family protein [Candidatus Magnetominusculus xianensis]KWT82967.1 membrane protein [Candidatus Magnetominusculus xianensis]MBF0403046.1 YitT family protein [Nitrospirota bacterium]
MNKTFLILKQYILIFVGALIASVGLEIFLIPNNIIDGGVTGVSIISGYLTGYPVGVFIFVLNLPFVVIGYKYIGKSFTASTFFAITCLSVMITLLHPVPGLTKDLLLAAVFGGIFLGIGTGLIIRYGGSLDGTEIVAILLDKRTGFTVGEVVLFFNIFILSSAGLVFGWDRAMYSLLAYLLAFKVIDITIEGVDGTKAVLIVSQRAEIIAEELMSRLGRGVTFFQGRGAFSGQSRMIIYSIISRLEIAKMKSIVSEIDSNAFVSIFDVHEVLGGTLHKRKQL